MAVLIGHFGFGETIPPTPNWARLNHDRRDSGYQPSLTCPNVTLKRLPGLTDNPTEPMTLLSI